MVQLGDASDLRPDLRPLVANPSWNLGTKGRKAKSEAHIYPFTMQPMHPDCRCVLFVKTTNFNNCICYFFKNQTMMKYVKQKSYLWLSPLSCLPVRFFMILLPVWVRVNISFKEGKTHGDMRRPSTFFVHPRAHACFSIGPLNIQSPQTC